MHDGAGFDVGTISLLGGHLALDFVNTVENRVGDEPDDTLRTPDDLRRWGVRLDVLRTGPVAGATADELARAKDLRGLLLAVLQAHTDHRAARPADLAALSAAVTDAYGHGTLHADRGTLRWTWDAAELATVRRRVAVAAVDLLAGPDRERIRCCGGPGCGWYFLDTSKNGSRRWCSMRGCGNQAKSRRRRARPRAPAGRTGPGAAEPPRSPPPRRRR